ncbi:OsmC family protein [Sphingobacterium spiritivorum]|uniref:OsmC family protein n=1 Tax=Sphingobacterium spiritivorum TaxID=258 RepID=UPI00191B3AAB|nr:OsmC family protein [Sphingobacterium spiritivorum]QQT26230.1 OsmC family protein [Sphingobacterium spiritivorum]
MNREITVTIEQEKYKTTITDNVNTLIVDEPAEVGGQDKGLAPTQLLLSSLGSCKAITVRMYADQKKWELNKVIIRLSSEVKRSVQQQTTYIKCHISFEGNLDDDQKKRLAIIADRCPVHKILSNPIVIDSNML